MAKKLSSSLRYSKPTHLPAKVKPRKEQTTLYIPKRKPLSKKQREALYEKYGGRCAYCGAKIKIGEMQADHIFSVYHTETGRLCGYDTPTDDELNSLNNFRPACRQCNYYKGVYSTDSFRSAIKEMLWKNLRKTFAYRMALKYGLIEEHDIDIVFYFEKEES